MEIAFFAVGGVVGLVEGVDVVGFVDAVPLESDLFALLIGCEIDGVGVDNVIDSEGGAGS